MSKVILYLHCDKCFTVTMAFRTIGPIPICQQCSQPLVKIERPHDRGNWKYLGFSSYREYLSSKLWSDIRQRILRKYAYNCVLCDKPAAEVHHISYDMDVLLGVDTTKLVSLCRDCHRSIEFTPDGMKRKTNDVVEVLRTLLKPHMKKLTTRQHPNARPLPVDLKQIVQRQKKRKEKRKNKRKQRSRYSPAAITAWSKRLDNLSKKNLS